MSKLIKIGKSIFNSENINIIKPSRFFDNYTIEVVLNNKEEKVECFDIEDDRDREMQRLYKMTEEK